MNPLERIPAVVMTAAWVFAANAAGPGPDFNTQIRPILESSCYRCHGPASQMSELRLDSKTHALKGGRSGKAIVPGHRCRCKVGHAPGLGLCVIYVESGLVE